MVHLHRHLLNSWTFVLGTQVLPFHHFNKSLSFVTNEGSVDGLDCLADLFPLNGHFRHSDKLELFEDLDVSFNKILITDGRVSVTKLGTYDF